jgi:DNA mismatch repair protein MutS
MSRLELTAAAACVTYVERTQLGKRPPLSPPSREAAGTTLAIDPATRANLELTRTLGGRAARLAARCDRPHRDGGRLAAAWRSGWRRRSPIRPRSRGGSMRSRFCRRRARARRCARTLARAPDMSRALARLSVGRGGPRDLAGLATASWRPISAGAAWRADAKIAAGDRAPCAEALRRPIARSRANSSARSPTNCR